MLSYDCVIAFAIVTCIIIVRLESREVWVHVGVWIYIYVFTWQQGTNSMKSHAVAQHFALSCCSKF